MPNNQAQPTRRGPGGRIAGKLAGVMATMVAAFGALVLVLAGEARAQASPGGGYPVESCYEGCGEPEYSPFNRPVRIQFGPDGRYEFVALGPAGQAEQMIEIIESVGGQVQRQETLGGLGQVSIVATFPNAAAQARAQELINALPGGALAPNHLYFQAQFLSRPPRLYAGDLIGADRPGGCRLPRSIAIGMIDGPVNTDHPALRGVNLVYEAMVDPGRGADASHGTGIAALLVGEAGQDGLGGFAQGARLHAISVFDTGENEPETDVERIVRALDRLVAANVRLINMSFAGPENATLGQAVSAAAARGVVMIAAAGNNARPVVEWPAAAPEVIAVTAVDAARRLFHRANTGVEIELSAPGVDIYTARAEGAGYASGTSFAAPIVTAIAARELAAGLRSTDALRARLRARAEVLGGGPNARFGYGLVQAAGC